MNYTYTGYKNWKPTTQELEGFYQNGTCPVDLFENEYLIIQDCEDNIIDKYCQQNGTLRKVQYKTINNSRNGKIKPRNIGQELAIDMLQDRTSKVKLIRGLYGSGKDLLMLNQALEYIERGKFQKIVFIRPNVCVAGVPDIGYLKGDMMDKLAWTLAPFYDKVGGQDGVDELINNNMLELVPLPFIRGRSFDNSIIYVCEGQNLLGDTVKLIISRAGDGSELWLNGDAKQIDRKMYENDNGLKLMIDKLAGHPLFSYVFLDKTERGEVANLANLLD